MEKSADVNHLRWFYRALLDRDKVRRCLSATVYIWQFPSDLSELNSGPIAPLEFQPKEQNIYGQQNHRHCSGLRIINHAKGNMIVVSGAQSEISVIEREGRWFEQIVEIRGKQLE